jgi:hypothetical protein
MTHPTKATSKKSKSWSTAGFCKICSYYVEAPEPFEAAKFS